MKLPFLKYLQALVACRWSNELILEKLAKLPIPLTQNFPEEGINQIRRKFALDDPDYFNAPFKSDYPDMDFLKKYKITELTYYLLKMDIGYSLKYITGSFDLAQDPDMFQKMTSLALANVTKEDIELLIHSKYNIHFNELEINAFLKYFFNTTGWSLGDKKKYLSYITDPDLEEFYEMAIEGDKSYLMWKLGIAPQVSIEQMLHDITSDAYYMFKEKTKTSSSESQQWAGLLLRSIERAEKLQTDKEKASDFFKDLETLIGKAKENSDIIEEMRETEEAPLVHIEDLNKGIKE